MTSRFAIACAQAVIGVLLVCGIWLGLPARWLPVDLLGTALALAALSAAIVVVALRGNPRALQWVKIVVWAELVLGTLTVTLLATSIAQLAGSYGPVGDGGAVLMGAIFALVLPYLVALPALQLRWLRRSEP
jgi:Kef-type K+ transport system membrane component KefB